MRIETTDPISGVTSFKSASAGHPSSHPRSCAGRRSGGDAFHPPPAVTRESCLGEPAGKMVVPLPPAPFVSPPCSLVRSSRTSGRPEAVYSASNTPAAPMPVPTHMVTMP